MKDFTIRERKALRQIRNWVVHAGRTPSVRELMKALGYRSPRSAQDLLSALAEKKAIRKLPDGDYQLRRTDLNTTTRAQTVEVPVIGTVAAGLPILADQNVEAFVSISTGLVRSSGKYFLLRVRGDSMNQAGIDDGDFVLVRQQATAEPGQTVVALVNDEATVKSYHPGSDVVVLKPHSSNRVHRPIVLDHDFQIQGVVIQAIHNLH